MQNPQPTDYVKEENEGARFAWYGDISPSYLNEQGVSVSVNDLDTQVDNVNQTNNIYNPNTSAIHRQTQIF